MKRLLALLLALALLLPCAACGGSAEPDGLRLYFVTQTREHGQVLQSQPYTGQDQPGPEEAVIAAEEIDELRRAIDALPPGDRALIYRKYYYRQSTAQMASELGLTARAVEGRLYRIKKRLGAALGGERNG